MKFKRILSLSLALMLAFSLMSFNISVSASETTSEYVAEPQVTNVKYYDQFDDEGNATWSDGTDRVKSPMVADNTLSRYYDRDASNNYYGFTSFSGVTFSKNSYYIQPDIADYENETYTTNDDEKWLEFSINRKATIYVLTKVSPSSSLMNWLQQDFTKIDGAEILTKYSSSSTNNKYRANVWKMESEDLPQDGSSVQDFVLYSCGKISSNAANFGVYSVVIDFGEDEETDCKLSNVKYNGESRSVISPMVVGVARFKNADDEDIDLFTSFNGYTFSENSYYIQPKLTDYSSEAAADVTAEFASFDLAQSADVYIAVYIGVTNNYLPWVDEEGYKAVGTDAVSLISSRSTSGKLYIENDTTASANGRKRAYLYKKTYEVAEGETLTVSLKGIGYNETATRSYGIIVDFGNGEAVPEELASPTVFSSSSHGTQEINGVSYSAYSLAFAKALPVYGLLRRTEYGMVISKTQSDEASLVIGAEGVTKIEADHENHPANSEGQYGILIYGAGYDCASTYYGRSYAVYGDEVVYGPVRLLESTGGEI